MTKKTKTAKLQTHRQSSIKSINLKYWFSLVAGILSALVVGYSLLAPIWGFPIADKIFNTGSVIVMVLSTILSVLTGEKISRKYSPDYMINDKPLSDYDVNNDIDIKASER